MKAATNFIFCLLLTAAASQKKEVVNVELEIEKNKVEAISSKYSDFGAVVLDDDIWFVSNREVDYVNWGENLWHKRKYYHIFQFLNGAKPDAEKTKIEVRKNKIFLGYHNGPVSFTSSGDTIFYTKVLRSPYRTDKKKLYKPQLFMAIKEKGQFKNETKLPFCDLKYTFAHPCFDNKSQTLYFVSDVDSLSIGGTDIFKVSLKEGQWEDMMNMGQPFNTTSNEQFPFMWKNKELFYSSNANGTERGLDIYWSWKDSKGEWSNPLKMKAPVNTDKDDFGIYLSENGKVGYLSSNEEGNDQLYQLTINRKITFGGNNLAGRFTYRNIDSDPSNLSVKIVDENGLTLQETKTDKKGAFEFKSIPYDQSYTIKVQDEEQDELYLQIFDKNGKKVAVLMSNKNGEFLYKKLEYEESILSYIEEEEIDLELNQADFQGQFLYSKKPGKFPSNVELYLEDENGNIVKETSTDKYGNFEFNKLDADENYYLKIKEEMDEDLLLLVYNSQDNVVAVLRKGGDKKELFRKIGPDAENNFNIITSDENPFKFKTNYLVGNVDYKKIEGDFDGGLKIEIFNEEELKLDEAFTNDIGEFRFNHLPLDNNYHLKISPEDENLKYELKDLYIKVYNRFGEQVGTLKYDEKGYFLYRPIALENENNLEIIDNKEDNLSLNFENNGNENTKDTKTENNSSNQIDKETEEPANNTTENSTPKNEGEVISTIYFDLNSSYLNTNNKKELKKLLEFLKENKSTRIDIKSYADSRADTDYNLWISKRRTERVKQYLIRQGIAASRINGEFFGEKYLVNNCENGVDCPEEKHRLNRRSEIILQ